MVTYKLNGQQISVISETADLKQSWSTYVSLVRISDGECAEAVGHLAVVIGEVVGSLDDDVLHGTVDACIDVRSFYAAINSRAHRSRL